MTTKISEAGRAAEDYSLVIKKNQESIDIQDDVTWDTIADWEYESFLDGVKWTVEQAEKWGQIRNARGQKRKMSRRSQLLICNLKALLEHE